MIWRMINDLACHPKQAGWFKLAEYFCRTAQYRLLYCVFWLYTSFTCDSYLNPCTRFSVYSCIVVVFNLSLMETWDFHLRDSATSKASTNGGTSYSPGRVTCSSEKWQVGAWGGWFGIESTALTLKPLQSVWLWTQETAVHSPSPTSCQQCFLLPMIST